MASDTPDPRSLETPPLEPDTGKRKPPSEIRRRGSEAYPDPVGDAFSAANRRVSKKFSDANRKASKGLSDASRAAASHMGASLHNNRKNQSRAWDHIKGDLAEVKEDMGRRPKDIIPGYNVTLEKIGDRYLIRAKIPDQRTYNKTSWPWDAKLFATGTGGTFFMFVRPGEIRPSGLPSNMFVDGSLWSATITADPTYIVLRVTTDGAVPTNSELVAKTTPADPIPSQESSAPSTFEVNLWIVAGNRLLRVVDYANLIAETSVALVTDKEDPVCAGFPGVNHYTWRVSATISD